MTTRSLALDTRQWLLIVSVLVVGAMACTLGDDFSTPTLTPKPYRTPTSIPANDDAAIRQLIQAEGQGIVECDIDLLQSLWDPDGVVIDANHTPTDTGDDTTWPKWAAIRHRYLNILCPQKFRVVRYPNLRFTIDGEKAIGLSDSLVDATYLKDDVRWSLNKISGTWKIAALTIHLSAGK